MKSTLTLTFCLVFSLSLFAQTNRTYDGSANNTTNLDWGQKRGHLMYKMPMAYDDSIASPAGISRPNPRVISNAIFDQPASIPNMMDISDFGWAFGQFMDHDLSLVLDNFSEPADIPVPAFDPVYDPSGTGTQFFRMFRSESVPGSGTSKSNPRHHVNDITSWIDASNVYGSDSARAMWLRTGAGGKMKTSAGNLLPFNTVTGEYTSPIDTTAPAMIIDGAPMPVHFIAGDERANEQPILTSLHTLFVREHNRICDSLAILNPSWDDEALYQRSRKIVGALFSAIAFEEWLPALGIQPAPYPGYNTQVDPRIMNVFSAAAFRLGHTLINGELIRIENDGSPSIFGNINLKDAFFDPLVVKDEGGIEPFFNGMATQRQQNFDAKVIDDLRNFLFGGPGSGGLDLVSININRGRERGLIDYNWIREEFGLTKYTSFSEITSDASLANELSTLYGSIEDIDPWVGMLSEDHMPGAAVGETIFTILKMQFEKLRDCDRFYYENDPSFSAAEITEIKSTRLSDIILRNTTINQIQANVFKVGPGVGVEPGKDLIAGITAYPNPASDNIHLKVNVFSPALAQVAIHDMTGRVVSTQPWRVSSGENTLAISLGEMPGGVYLVRIEADGAQRAVRIVKR